MHTPLAIARKANNMIAYTIPGFLQREDIHDEIMHTLSNLQKIFPRWVICTCRFMHKGFFYISDNAREALGFDGEILTNALNMDVFLNRLHPADLEDYSKGLQRIAALYHETAPEERYKLRFIFNYRLQHPDGRYMHIHDEKAMLPIKGDLNLYYMLLRDISNEVPFAGIRMTGYTDHGSRKVIEYNASAEAASQLSPRENELLPLMKQGLSTKEIAYTLGISHNTVRNMRQKLFQKFQVNNAIELLNKIDMPMQSMSAIMGAREWGLSSAV